MTDKKDELLKKRKAALADARREIKRCKLSRNKSLELDPNGYLVSFPEEIRRLTWLTSLSVRCTDINTLPDWIGELANLRTLDISINQKLETLPASLAKLKGLKRLDLDNTGIKKLEPFLGGLRSLEFLGISPYNISEVPQFVLDLPKLKRIETRGYNTDHLPALVAKQRGLNTREALRRIELCKKLGRKKLDLSFLYLDELPRELSSMHWLEQLNLLSNKLEQLPEWVGDFPNLAILDLEGNELTSLPDSIGNLKKLKRIMLGMNRLQTLPETFGGLSSLEYFSLDQETNHPALEKMLDEQGSWFASLPESFGNLASLKHFHVSNTKLVKLPESFGKLSSLASLIVQSDLTLPISFFPDTMRDIKSLRKICISSFGSVPGFVAEMKNLTSLDLSHNPLKALPEFIGGLKKLKELNLHSTWIGELPEWIGKLKNLVGLDISCNGITANPKMDKKLPKLKRYCVGCNPFSDKANKE